MSEQQDDRPAVYEENGKVIYRASAYGGCLKMLAGLRLGYEGSPPPQSMVDGVFKRGHTLEDVALKKLAEEGWEVKDRQKAFELALTGRAVVRCHVDAISATVVDEVKSQSAEEYAKWSAEDPWKGEHWSRYAWQVSAVILATGKPCAIVRISTDLEMDKFMVREPPHSLAELRARHFAVEKIVRSGVLPVECEMSYPCPLWRLHPDTRTEPIDLDDKGIDEHAKIYDHARNEEKKWHDIKEAAKRALRIGIRDEKVRTNSGIIVSFFSTHRRKLSAKLLEEHGLTEEDVTTDEVGERIDVKVPQSVIDAAKKTFEERDGND